MPESIFTKSFRAALQSATAGNAGRYGWYLQQFIKIAAAASEPPDAVVLIWDADTIPLRPIRFVGPGGQLQCYTGSEFHVPYFHTIERLLGMPKAMQRSFITQCLPMRSGWVQEMLACIARRHGCDAYTAIIRSIDFSQSSGFSEYETLGTFALTWHPKEFQPNGADWSRHGYRLIGGPGNLDTLVSKRLLRNYDYVAFEKWEGSAVARGCGKRMERLGRFLAGLV